MMEGMEVLVTGHGTPRDLGLRHGALAAGLIHGNLDAFWAFYDSMGLSRMAGEREILAAERDHPLGRLEMIDGIAAGAGLSYKDVLAYNLLRHAIYDDECSVAIAHGKAGKGGRTYFLKNSDKVGGPELSGDGFHQGKEINVFVYVRPKGLPAYMGVGAAGTTGLKFGCSDQGVAVGTNIARTVELKSKQVSLSTVRAADRAELARIALEAPSAREAAMRVVAEVTKSPMGTPGNMEFVDAEAAWFLEGSYDRMALSEGRDGVYVRTNRFEIFADVNDPEDVSSHARNVRASQILRQHAGAVDENLLIGLSQDHVNGPGLNALCRHDQDSRSETSLAAGVVIIDPAGGEKTRIHVALGKPCVAWNTPEGHLTATFEDEPESVHQSFYNGAAWKAMYTEEYR
jgi:hypothetical protein